MHSWLNTYLERDLVLKSQQTLIKDTIQKMVENGIHRKQAIKRLKQSIWKELRDRK